MKKKSLVVLCVCLGLMAFSFTAAQAQVKQISMGTSSVGGLFYNIGAPVAQCINKALPELNITVEFTEGSTENLRLIGQQKMHLGVISPMIGYYAREGSNMFKGKPIDFRVVARLLPNGNIWTTLADSDIKEIRDLKGKKVGVGTGGIGVISRGQLAAHGIDYQKDIKPFFSQTGALADILKDGAVDASFLTAELADLVTATHKIKIIPWKEEDLKPFLEKFSYFGEYIYPAGRFKGVDYPVLTVDNGIQLICDKDLDDELVYKLAKAAAENLDCVTKIYAPAKVLTPAWMASKLGNPFHPGAIKYYKDKGLWKD